LTKEVIIIPKKAVEENLYAIQKAVESVAFYLKKVPTNELDECFAEIEKLFREQRFYSQTELLAVANEQLFVLEACLRRLIDEGDVKEEEADKALLVLKSKKGWAVTRASETPIRENPAAEYLPLVPVIDESVFNASILMKMLENENGFGQNSVPLTRIKNNYSYQMPQGCYWLVDVRINELRYDCPFLTVAEAISYAIQTNNILSRYCLQAVESRYKHKKNDPELCLSLLDGLPTLCRLNDRNGRVVARTAKPSCAFRIVA